VDDDGANHPFSAAFRPARGRGPAHRAQPRARLAYALADRGQLDPALETLDQAPLDDWRLLKARGQVLNWMGRHREARVLFDHLSTQHAADPEVLEGRALAARWGGDPVTAQRDAALLERRFPERGRLRRELRWNTASAPRRRDGGLQTATDCWTRRSARSLAGTRRPRIGCAWEVNTAASTRKERAPGGAAGRQAGTGFSAGA
jgi:hypothetical protein